LDVVAAVHVQPVLPAVVALALAVRVTAVAMVAGSEDVVLAVHEQSTASVADAHASAVHAVAVIAMD